MAGHTQAYEKLHEYASKVRDTEYNTTATHGKLAYDARLDKTIQALQNQVKEQQDALEQLRASGSNLDIEAPSPDLKSRLRQLHTITAVYKSMAPTEPALPPAGSPLPALLAIRSTQRLIDQTKSSIRTAADSLSDARKQINREEADLRDARLITDALEKRIARLRVEYDEKSQKSPEEAAKDMIREHEARKANLDKETKRLVRTFNKFIDQHLAGMLAAEELGGPVVGDLREVGDETLEAGFNRKGKAKRPKATAQNHDAKRQRRIDEIWGRQPGDEAAETGKRSEREAAGTEMRALTEDLLNAAAGDDTSGAYVGLQRDSAAARFLVRAKVAQFHPRDARRLRLIDFARELDD
ncbi:hypothetical protein LPUS_04568 [Lasallia pustulata]|uniref:Centromere Cenp-K n=1 Tax=Lasallia pustulata TaxID=136370 RepID=A0A1W5CX86_9LECA|nr:hypothetical protein LPUS_04568 [Lasallia pustulata]